MSINFQKEEMQCHCGCGLWKVSHRLETRLEEFRSFCGFALPVNSAVRCLEYNIKPVSEGGVGSTKTSSHVAAVNRFCEAADLEIPALPGQRYTFFKGIGLFFPRIFVYTEKNFTHVDVDPFKPQNVWSYLT